jgi:hypothetical protein
MTEEIKKSPDEIVADQLMKEPNLVNTGIPRVIPTPRAAATPQPQPQEKKPSTEQIADAVSNMSDEDLAKLTSRVQEQLAAKASQPDKKSASPRYITDFSNVSERDVFNLDVPIQAFSHELPDFLTVKLVDSNFEARWIQTNSRRLGQAIAEGFTYVTNAELAGALQVYVTPDASGHFVYADVVLMKLPKAKLYARLRSNFIRSLSVTKNVSALHEKMRQHIEQDIENQGFGEDFKKYKEKNAMGVYSPLIGA